MSAQGLFPRYRVEKLKGKITIRGQLPLSSFLKNVSLSGIQIRGKEIIPRENLKEVIIEFPKQDPIHLKLTQQWQEENDGDGYRSGYALKFSDKREYIKWYKLMKALHIVRMKKSKSL